MERRLAVPVAGSMWAILRVSLWAPPAVASDPKLAFSPGGVVGPGVVADDHDVEGLAGDEGGATGTGHRLDLAQPVVEVAEAGPGQDQDDRHQDDGRPQQPGLTVEPPPPGSAAGPGPGRVGSGGWRLTLGTGPVSGVIRRGCPSLGVSVPPPGEPGRLVRRAMSRRPYNGRHPRSGSSPAAAPLYAGAPGFQIWWRGW